MGILHKTFQSTPGEHEGFTAVELLIAMAVFSFVLTLSTIGFIQINQMYQHGVAAQKVQDATRHIKEDMTRTLRESDYIRVDNTSGTAIVCTDSRRFFVNSEALYKQPFATDEEANGPCLPEGGLSLEHASRLTDEELILLDFTVTPFNALEDDSGYSSAQVKLSVGTAATQDLIEDDRCEPTEAGSHFCAVSEQITTVTTRGAM